MAPKKSAGTRNPSHVAANDAENVQESIDRKRILPGALVSMGARTVLGPAYNGAYPEPVKALYPGNPNDLPFVSITPNWQGYHKPNPTRLWPIKEVGYSEWLQRVSEAKKTHWKAHGLYDIIMLSAHDFPQDRGLLFSASQFWSSGTNSFHFFMGMMAPTILDICLITGVSAVGKEADYFTACSHPVLEYPKDRQYGAWITQFCGPSDEEVSDIEHVAFLIFWLNKYLFCVSSGIVTKDFTDLACALHQNETYALAPLILSHLYRSMHKFVQNAFFFGSGPLWIMTMWLWIYFPGFGPIPEFLPEHTCYAQHFLDSSPPDNVFDECFTYFYNVDSKYENWLPFKNERIPPHLHPLRLSLETEPLAREAWSSFLTTRDLLYGTKCPAANDKAGVEFYNPAQFARQFGLAQAVPIPPYQSHNLNFKSREVIDKADLSLVKTESIRLRSLCELKSYPEDTGTTSEFRHWWGPYRDQAFKQSPKEVLERILPPSKVKSATPSTTAGIKRKSMTSLFLIRCPTI